MVILELIKRVLDVAAGVFPALGTSQKSGCKPPSAARVPARWLCRNGVWLTTPRLQMHRVALRSAGHVWGQRALSGCPGADSVVTPCTGQLF